MYRKSLSAWVGFIVLAMGIQSSYGQSTVGTSAAQFLKIGVGSRAMAMGGAYVALANDASALYWNPAGVTSMRRIELIAAHTEWFAGISHQFVGVTVPLGPDNVVGLSAILLTAGAMEQTTIQAPDGNGVFFDVTDLAVGLTYGMQLTDKVSAGLTGKFIRQTGFNESASTFALDIGLLLNTGYRGLSIGMNFSNLGGELQLDGPDLLTKATGRLGTSSVGKLATESFPLPISFRVGVAMEAAGKSGGSFFQSDVNRVTLTLDGTHQNDSKETVGFGVEYAWNDLVAIRGGYILNHDVATFSLGGGVMFNLASGFDVSADYAYANLGLLENVHRVGLSLRF